MQKYIRMLYTMASLCLPPALCSSPRRSGASAQVADRDKASGTGQKRPLKPFHPSSHPFPTAKLRNQALNWNWTWANPMTEQRAARGPGTQSNNQNQNQGATAPHPTHPTPSGWPSPPRGYDSHGDRRISLCRRGAGARQRAPVDQSRATLAA